jgi:hypothetical protein
MLLVTARSLAQAPPPRAPADSTADEGAVDRGADLDAILARLRVDNATLRRAALQQLDSVDASDLPAIRQRLMAPLPINALNVHAAMLRALHAATGGRPDPDYDLLEALVQVTPRAQDVNVATERVALARAAGRIPSSDAGRLLVAFGLDHQRIFRLEAMRIIRNELHDYVLPALIEFRHPSDDARMFIRQVREALHRVTPGETVQTRDNALLAEILRSYGSSRQTDALNVVVSFVNSDRAQVREAARWAVGQYGRDAINALRQAYENYVGEDANPAWGWDRTAHELYAANDRRRDEEVSHALDEGLAAAHARDYPRMMERFEFVLARHPLYERRTEMVPALMAYAHVLESSDVAHAEQVYRMAARIDPNGGSSRTAQSAALFLDAERALAAGVADPELYRVAVRTDPSNLRAQAQLDAVAQVDVLRARKRRRTVIALGLFALAVAGLGAVLARARRRSATASPEPLASNTKVTA